MEFKKGEKIALEGGNVAVIEKTLGEGGQGIVYEVLINNKPYALKWYTCKLANKNAFKQNMKTNILNGAPDNKFLWPLYMANEQKDSFGYVMNLRPKNFSEFSDILNNKVKFPTTELVIKSALNIVNGFRSLHRKGLSYQDLNDGNFFIDVSNGEVLICDNDNVTPDGKKNPGNVGGKPGYMAPEIVSGKAHPSTLTDCHSLAVILFKLFCRHDPLMGEAFVQSVCITEKREMELYGTHPVFIFDPNDKSNRPVSGIHPNPIRLWPRYPGFFQEAFITSFAEGMKNPNARIPENEWQKILIRLREDLLFCPACGAEIFLSLFEKGKQIQFRCGHNYSYPYSLVIPQERVPLFPGNKLYACHTVDSSDDYNTLTGEVVMNKNNPALWGIKNLSDFTWYMTIEQGGTKAIKKGEVVPVASNIQIQFSGITGKIDKN
jgi:serine/threonine protein kinase